MILYDDPIPNNATFLTGYRLTAAAPQLSPVPTSSLCYRLLKVALPIQLALIFGFGLLCLYDPEYCDGFTCLGLVVSPHLRYVDGPPPT